MPRDTRTIRSTGFTLIELLVVISIMTIMVAMAFPFMAKMASTAKGRAGQTSVSVATNAVRILNQRMSQGNIPASSSPWGGAGNYSGTIALFTQAGEIRLCINNQLAREPGASGNYLEDTVAFPAPFANGYKDIKNLDYLNLPSSTRIAGVTRTVADGRIYYAAPFALRFDEQGHLVTDERVIYYDGNYSGRYDTNADRASIQTDSGGGYNPDDFDPRMDSTITKSTGGGSIGYKYELPFETIDTVMAVMLYNVDDFRSEELVWGSTSTSQTDLHNFFKNFGTALYFSPHTGLVLKD